MASCEEARWEWSGASFVVIALLKSEVEGKLYGYICEDERTHEELSLPLSPYLPHAHIPRAVYVPDADLVKVLFSYISAAVGVVYSPGFRLPQLSYASFLPVLTYPFITHPPPT